MIGSPEVTWPSGLEAPFKDADGDSRCLDYIWIRGAIAVDSCRLAFDRPAVGEEPKPVRLLQVAIEMAGEHSGERPVRERQLGSVAVDELSLWRLLARHLQHGLTLIDPDHFAGEKSRDEARAAGHVERSNGRKGADNLEKPVPLFRPARRNR